MTRMTRIKCRKEFAMSECSVANVLADFLEDERWEKIRVIRGIRGLT
jgi:hypothetical protein